VHAPQLIADPLVQGGERFRHLDPETRGDRGQLGIRRRVILYHALGKAFARSVEIDNIAIMW
jgi:hypothetical protein